MGPFKVISPSPHFPCLFPWQFLNQVKDGTNEAYSKKKYYFLLNTKDSNGPLCENIVFVNFYNTTYTETRPIQTP